MPPWPIVVLSVVALRAIAEPTAASVSWRAPPQCPDARDVTLRIAALVGREPKAGELHVDGTVRAVEGGFQLRVRVGAGALVDERSIVADRCEALADTTALVAALIVDPVATTESVRVPEVVARAEQRAGAVGSASAIARPESRAARDRGRDDASRVDRDERRRTDRSDRGVGVFARVGGGGQFGAVPGFTGGLELALGVGSRRVRGEIAGSYWFPRPVDAGDDGALRVHLGVVTPRVCGLLPQRRIDVVACGGVELGAMRGDIGGTARLPLWLGLTAELGIRIPVAPRVAIRVGAGAVAPLVFPVFRLVDPTGAPTRVIHRPSGAAARVNLGVELRLRGVEVLAPRRGR